MTAVNTAKHIWTFLHACRKNKRHFGGTTKLKQINNAVLPTLLIVVLPLIKQAVKFCHFEGGGGVAVYIPLQLFPH